MRSREAPAARVVRRGRRLAALTSVLLLLASGCAMIGAPAAGMDHRVADTSAGASDSAFERGSMVRTFQTVETGGVEEVVARDPTNEAQVTRVRAYLQQEVARFQAGAYDDPARTHGMEMPGSKALEVGYGRVQVSYADLPGGGRITYNAPDQPLIQAIHTWFGRRQMGG